MIRWLSTSVILLICSYFCIGQQLFDYSEDFYSIRREFNTKRLSFDSLLTCFNKNINLESHYDAIALMIGYSATDDYRPFQQISKIQKMLQLISQKKYSEALNICDKILSVNPVCYSALMHKSDLLKRLKKDSVDIYWKKFKVLENAMLSLCDGSFEKPFFILNPMDAQSYLTFRKGWSIIKVGSGKDYNGIVLDMLEVQTKNGKEKYYFNVSHAKLRRDNLLNKVQTNFDKKVDREALIAKIENTSDNNKEFIDAFLVIKATSKLDASIPLPPIIRINRNNITSDLKYNNKDGQLLDANIIIGQNVIELRDAKGHVATAKIVSLTGSEMINVNITVNQYIKDQNYWDIDIDYEEK